MATIAGLDLGVDVGSFFNGFGGYFGWIFWVFIILVVLGLASWWVYNLRVYYIRIKYFSQSYPRKDCNIPECRPR